MSRRTRLPLLLSCAALLAAGVPSAEAQDTATAVLKSGQRQTGSNSLIASAGDRFIVGRARPTNRAFQRIRWPTSTSAGLPTPNLNLSGSQEAVVMRDRLRAEGSDRRARTRPTSADLSAASWSSSGPRTVRNAGSSRSQVARVVLRRRATVERLGGPSSGAATTPPARARATPSRPSSSGHPPASSLNSGEVFAVKASGEISLRGADGPKSSPGGTDKPTRPIPMPSVPTGALIGRIGNRPAIPDRNGNEHRGTRRRPTVPGHQRQQRVRQPGLVSGRHSALGPTPTVAHGFTFGFSEFRVRPHLNPEPLTLNRPLPPVRHPALQ